MNHEAIATAAAEGIRLDGLHVDRVGDRYRVETPDGGPAAVARADLEAELADRSPHVENWTFWHGVGGEGTAGRAFLRWLEGADREESLPERYAALATGRTRTWGELAITASLDGPDGRRYSVRHRGDRDRPLEDLTVHADPAAAREIATTDERGRYRPLKTAPTLRDGWALSPLSHGDLLDAIRWLYPASVANWHREREEALDVDHWAATAERQTGIYEIVSELSPAAVGWLAEAACVDGACVKRRRWEYSRSEPLEADPGEGRFPCREPCSFVLAAARQIAIQETEEERSWTGELSRGEVTQLEALVEAAATGDLGEVREAEFASPLNPLRLRYLRAKRFEDGSGPLRPTEGE